MKSAGELPKRASEVPKWASELRKSPSVTRGEASDAASVRGDPLWCDSETRKCAAFAAGGAGLVASEQGATPC